MKKSLFHSAVEASQKSWFAYDLSPGVSSGTDFRRYAGSLLTFTDNPRTGGSELYDLSSTPLTLGLQATGTSVIRMDFEDINQKHITVRLSVSTATQYYTLTQAILQGSGVTGFDYTKIKTISLVIDDQVASATANGTVSVSSSGLHYEVSVNGSPTGTPTSLSVLQPVASSL